VEDGSAIAWGRANDAISIFTEIDGGDYNFWKCRSLPSTRISFIYLQNINVALSGSFLE